MVKIDKPIKELWMKRPGLSDVSIIKVGGISYDKKVIEIKIAGEGYTTSFEIHSEDGSVRIYPWKDCFCYIC